MSCFYKSNEDIPLLTFSDRERPTLLGLHFSFPLAAPAREAADEKPCSTSEADFSYSLSSLL